MWDRQELGYHWERITKNNWKSEESDLRGYLVGNPILLINVVGKCEGYMDKFGKFEIQMNGQEIWDVLDYDWITVNIGCKRIGS